MKRGLVVKLILILLVLLISLASLILADIDHRMACTTDADCADCEDANQMECYCKHPQSSCWINTSSPLNLPPPVVNQPPSNQSLRTNTTTNITTNTSASSTNLTSPAAVGAASLQTAFNLLQQQVSASETRTQQQLAALQTSLGSLQQQVSQLSQQMQSLSSQGGEVGGLRNQLNSVSSGLASLQQNLDVTKTDLSAVEKNLKTEQRRTKLLSGLLFSIIIFAVAGILVYALSHQRRKLNPHILKYITEHVQRGIKYADIKTALENAGWDVEDIEWAYRSTIKHNDQNYQQSGQKPGLSAGRSFDPKKIAAIFIISILIIISVIFLLKGITTGQAIRFSTEEELSQNVLQELQANIANNQFYPLVQSALICMEVKDGSKSVSFKIVKTAGGHNIDSAPKPCSEDDRYNAAIKFTSWDSFSHLMNDFTCRTARELHTTSRGIKGVYVLPSQLVLPGFRKNQQIDYQPFCPLVRPCLTETELVVLGC